MKIFQQLKFTDLWYSTTDMQFGCRDITTGSRVQHTRGLHSTDAPLTSRRWSNWPCMLQARKRSPRGLWNHHPKCKTFNIPQLEKSIRNTYHISTLKTMKVAVQTLGKLRESYQGIKGCLWDGQVCLLVGSTSTSRLEFVEMNFLMGELHLHAPLESTPMLYSGINFSAM